MFINIESSGNIYIIMLLTLYMYVLYISTIYVCMLYSTYNIYLREKEAYIE